MQSKPIKLTFVGDIMCDNEQLKNLTTKGSDGFEGAFEDLKNYLHESDYVVGNLEAPVAGRDAKYSFEQYRMNAPEKFAEAVKKVGVDLVSTANNHSLDRGIEGLKSTVKNLDDLELEHVGTYLSENEKHYVIKDISGVKVAFLSYTYGTNAFDNGHYLKKNERYLIDLFQDQEKSGLLNRIVFSMSDKKKVRIAKKILKTIDPSRFSRQIYEVEENAQHWKRQLKRDIAICKERADIVVMLAHIGGQYNPQPSAYTRKITKWLIDRGVDTIVCNHEHVIHPVDVKGNNVIAYALGNFFGANGVISPPFDKMSEYSLLFHVYIDQSSKQKVNYTFSICKTVQDSDGKLKNILLNDLIDSCQGDAKKSLIADCGSIVETVTGVKNLNFRPSKEYPLS